MFIKRLLWARNCVRYLCEWNKVSFIHYSVNLYYLPLSGTTITKSWNCKAFDIYTRGSLLQHLPVTALTVPRGSLVTG